MKKVFLLFFLFLFASGLVYPQHDQFGFKKKPIEKKKEGKKTVLVSAGVGYGIPFGVIGVMAEFTPVEYVGITGGFGYAIEGVGYSLGIRIYPIGESEWAPLISAYYGIVGIIIDEETFAGGALGGGLKFRQSKFSITAEILYLIHEKREGYDYGSSIKFSAGFLWHF